MALYCRVPFAVQYKYSEGSTRHSPVSLQSSEAGHQKLRGTETLCKYVQFVCLPSQMYFRLQLRITELYSWV
jgi:hypothetical protein